MKRRLACWMIAILLVFPCFESLRAQAGQLPDGFQRIEGKHIVLVTDVPVTDEVRVLTKVFDSAVEPWCQAFGIPASQVANWRAEVYLMRARERFVSAGFLPNTMPNFPYGFQWGNRLWISEQETDYYNRHLLLHEGTHWVMSRFYGENGPPWLMEGLAELYATHRWDGATIQLGVIPQSKQDVPGWGRIHLIQQQLADGVAPALETVLRYDTSAHQQAEAYAWSWAAVVFLKYHPDTRDAFEALLKQDMKPDMTQTRWLYRRLQGDWPGLRAIWNATLTDLEYGFDPTRKFAQFSKSVRALDKPARIAIDCGEGWQGSGLRVATGQQLAIQATGRYRVVDDAKPWVSEADGVTLEYYRGQPLGRLMMIVLNPLAKVATGAEMIEPLAVGAELKWQAKSDGELFFRVNEPIGSLSDNSGSLEIILSPVGQ